MNIHNVTTKFFVFSQDACTCTEYSIRQMIFGDVRVQTGATDRTCPLIYALGHPEQRQIPRKSIAQKKTRSSQR